MSARATMVLLLFFSGLQGLQCTCSNLTWFATQLDALLADYERDTAPGSPTVITVSFQVRHATVRDHESVVRLLADLEMSWKDSRLTWNTSDWNCGSALVAAERLWLPDIQLINVASSTEDNDALRARLASDGSVIWVSRLDVTAPISLQLEDWPRDKQIAEFKFASRTHTTDELEIEIKSLEYATVFESGTWEIVSLIKKSELWEGATGAEQRLVSWTLTLRRRAEAHVLATRVVLCTAVLFLIAAIILPPNIRAPLAACASLTVTIWLVTALARLGESRAAPRVISAASALCACGGVACACAALLQGLARRSGPLPRVLRNLVSSASTMCKLTPPEEPHMVGAVETGAWAAVAQLLDLGLRGVLIIILFIVLCVCL